jgi:hypothetical protein
MIRQGEQLSAMVHIKKYFGSFGDNRHEVIRDAAGMLAFVNPSDSPYKKLFTRRLWVQDEVSTALDIRDVDHY